VQHIRSRPRGRFRCFSRPKIDGSQEIMRRYERGGSRLLLLGRATRRNSRSPWLVHWSMPPNRGHRDETGAKTETSESRPGERIVPQESWTGPVSQQMTALAADRDARTIRSDSHPRLLIGFLGGF
jgi:hypothetical protein